MRVLRMNEYLRRIKRLVNNTNLLGVLGNESVDLDSAVSSITLAYHIDKFGTSSRVIPTEKRRCSYEILPIINCKKAELPLKTEVVFWLKHHGIELDNLVCRDEIDISKNVKNLILVDHHVSPHNEIVISVIDHRPYDENSKLIEECAVNINEVGSCGTLILSAIKNDLGSDIAHEILRFLHGPIVLDTINFSSEADRVRELDFEMAEFIEKILDIENPAEARRKLYDELVTARADISALDSLQLLSKDLKIIANANSSVRVAIPGVGYVFDYVELPNAEENVRVFAERESIDVVMLMGMRPSGNSVERMLGVINIKNEVLYADILNTIKTMINPELKLHHKSIHFMGGEFFQQKNVKASRKQILPVIKELLKRY